LTRATPGLGTGILLALLLLGCRPASEESPSGAALYARYCASCHGVTARGDGPVAGALRAPPPDLTTIAQRAGRFDEGALITVIDGRRLVLSHGPREMPVWGAVFDEELAGQPHPGRTALLRAQILADYLRTLQQ
jgi:mono/diheme cytochrome c family protein